MLTYFPTPYPGEWWYSVLCRYHVRSGHSKHATTISELYGGRPMVHGRLIPGGDCAAILSNLPSGVLSIDDVLANHTLLPYYTRFFETDKKRQVWEALQVGRGSGITSVRTQMPDGTEGLKFCPNCYLLDTQEYGEPFWRRVHQIPLLGYCPMHKIRLVTVPIKFARLSEVFLPLGSVQCQEVEHGKAPWMEPLTDMLTALLCRDYAPTVGYNNLHTALINAGYGVDKISKYQTLSVEKIQEAARAYYGAQIYEQYFASLSAAVLSRLVHWQLSSPDRYALLAVLVGLDADTLFGPALGVTDPLLERLLSCKEAGVVYGKSDLAAKMGIQPGQLDSLAAKYQIEPFWRQIRQERNRCIRLLLTDNEYDAISQAAKENGNTPLAVFARTIILDVLQNKER
ncbi:TniQ family protein [uncultured Flavonifractor sp.]|uniref:TniQ family protein n=1 Tax=uncultured Flavonifractor sp. TaxID=1193534 RepID=UPI0026320D2D|nr:TniQ family protein [uncultured Flavonifractor sp.]